MKAMQHQSISLTHRISNILLRYHTTLHSTTNQRLPATCFFDLRYTLAWTSSDPVQRKSHKRSRNNRFGTTTSMPKSTLLKWDNMWWLAIISKAQNGNPLPSKHTKANRQLQLRHPMDKSEEDTLTRYVISMYHQRFKQLQMTSWSLNHLHQWILHHTCRIRKPHKGVIQMSSLTSRSTCLLHFFGMLVHVYFFHQGGV